MTAPPDSASRYAQPAARRWTCAPARTDADSAAALRELAGHGFAAGPCGAAALAGARAALTGQGSDARRAALAIGPDATVVLICTEGAAANPRPDRPPDTAAPGTTE